MFGWFESSNEEDKALSALENKTGNLTRLLKKSAVVALIGTMGFVSESRAATASNGDPSPDKPLVEAVADDDIDEVLDRAEDINEDERFTADDLDDYAEYNKLLVDELGGLVDRVQSATNQGDHERAVSMLRTVQSSVENMHKNVTKSLGEYQQRGEKPPAELVTFAEQLTQTADMITAEVKTLLQAEREHGDQADTLASVLRQWTSQYNDASHVDIDIDKGLDAVANGEDVTVTITTESSQLQVAKDKATFMSRQLQDEAGVTAEEDHDYEKTNTGYEWVLTLTIQQT